MEKKFKLSLTRACELAKRELGMSAAGMKKPESMNGNPGLLCYELLCGNTHVTLYLKAFGRVIHVYSIDEVFIDVTNYQFTHNTPKPKSSAASSIRSEVPPGMFRTKTSRLLRLRSNPFTRHLPRKLR